MPWKVIIKQNKYFFVLITVIFAFSLFLTWETVIDDSYITFRYSANLAKYFRICWNITDNPPVEGYSNPLWMILNAFAFSLNINMVLFSKILSILSLIFILILFFVIFRENTLVFKLIACMLLLIPQTYIHLNSCLETLLYAFLTLLIFEKIYKILFYEKIDYYSIPTLCFFLIVLRPEGFIISAFSFIFYLIYSFKLLPGRKNILSVSLIMFTLITIYFIFKYNYFGYIFPNTYYVKVGDIKSGKLWLINSIYLMLPILLPVLLSIWFKRNIKFIVLFLIFSFLSVMSYMVSFLMMDYSFRFLYHILPVILFAFGITANEYAIKFKHYRYLIITFSVIFIIFCWMQINVLEMFIYGKNLNEAHVNFGKQLYSVEIPAEYKTLCIGDAGAIPYYSQWNCVDFTGLNDLVIAHKLQNREDYIKNKKCSILMLYSSDGVKVDKFQYGFDPKKVLEEYEYFDNLKWNQNYFLLIYLRKDLNPEISEKIKKGIEVSLLSSKQNTVLINKSEIFRYFKNRVYN
jgi:arabinofuranosyltransferase